MTKLSTNVSLISLLEYIIIDTHMKWIWCNVNYTTDYTIENIVYPKLYRWAMEFCQGLAVLGGMGWGVVGIGVRPEVSRWLGWCLGGGLMVCHCLAGALRVDLLRQTPCLHSKLTVDYRKPDHASRVCIICLTYLKFNCL